MNNKYIKGLAKGVFLFGAALFSMTSCQDFFDAESTYVIDADKERLNNPTDTIYSLMGIITKMQAIGDRTVLFGEARGDLVSTNKSTNADLLALANFDVDDENKYNSPADYYAVINNCNYYIAHADTTLKNKRNPDGVFIKEYAAVKAIRAWTYLQLVTTYGKVPFYTEPLTTKEQAEKNFPMYDIKQVCDYFINEDGLDKLVEYDMPSLGDIAGRPSKKFYFPVRFVLGDLNLWAENYLDAARWYSDFIYYFYDRFGSKINPITNHRVEWKSPTWEQPSTWFEISGNNIHISTDNWYSDTYHGSGEETVTMIPMDSIPSAGYFSELPAIFNSAEAENYAPQLNPSKYLMDLSMSQTYLYASKTDSLIAPTSTDYRKCGDLRLGAMYVNAENGYISGGKTYDIQYIMKYPYRSLGSNTPVKHNVRIYRRTLAYLRLAEAMNRAGFPRYAFQVLSSGINNEIIRDSIAPYTPEFKDYMTDETQALKLIQFMNTYGFNGGNETSVNTTYKTCTERLSYDVNNNCNTIGLHTRGSGFTPSNPFYQMPKGTVEEQMKAVEDMIIDEGALEFAFEGYRYYDLLRVALRRSASEPDYLSKKINAARKGTISKDLNDKTNWFLHYKGQIGY